MSRELDIDVPKTKRPVQFSVELVMLYAVFIVAVLGFAVIAVEVREQQPPRIDIVILEWFRSIHTPALDKFVPVITNFGGPVGGTLLALFVAGLFMLKQEWRRVSLIVLSVGGAAVLNVVLKATFERQRPDLWERLVSEHSYSFPSGHAMMSAALGVSLAVALWDSRWRWWGIAIGGIYMVVISATRLYLGVHYPTDVIAGWFVSAAWVALVTLMLYGRMSRKMKFTKP